MTGPLPDPPDLDPQKLAGTNFGRSRRGFEPTEVRSMMGRAADALRVYAERDTKMSERIAELSQRLDEAEAFDEDRVTEILGSETARIVAAARDAAAEIRSLAQSDADELEQRTRTEAEAEAETLVGAAKADREAAEQTLSEATESTRQMVADATASCEAMVAGATEEAEALLGAAREEADALRSDAQARHDELMSTASSVLEERTTEAEAAAAEIRERAAIELAEASEDAANRRAEARTEAERLVATATEDAEQLRESAKEQGRAMVEEARDLRRQMLHDAADKARIGRQKVEAAKAAREAVVEAIRSAGGHLGEVLAELGDSDKEMRRAADTAALSIVEDLSAATAELEQRLDARLAEDDGPSVGAGEPELLDADVTLVTVVTEEVELSEVVEINPDVAVDEADIDDSLGADLDGADLDRDEAGDDEVGEDKAHVTVDGTEDAPTRADSELGDGSETPDAHDGDVEIASVHDLFERIRAEEPSTSGAEASPSEAAVSEMAVSEAEVALGSNVAVLEGARVEEDAEEVIESAVADPEAPPTDDEILAARTELLAPAEKLTTRAVKRLFGDEQNEVLDRTRRLRRTRAEVADLLGEDDSSAVGRFVEVLTDPYLLAASAGAHQWAQLDAIGSDGDRSEVSLAAADVVDSLTAQVTTLLDMRRARVRDLLGSHSEAGADNSELVDRIRSLYRDYRGSEAASLAGDLAAGGFATGSSVAARAGTSQRWRWVIDNGGRPCADAEDNALEGPLACGEPFPTGDLVPPAHPGCRCIVVPVP